MGWIERLKKGSFEGIEFVTTGDVFRLGHRVVIDESPFHNDASSRVLGRKARQFTMSFLFLGDDYDLQRDRFVSQVEKSPIGILVHPRYGPHRVTITEAEIADEFASGSRCDVEVTFIHTPASAGQPKQTSDTKYAPAAAISTAKAAALTDITENADVSTSLKQANFYNDVDNAVTAMESTMKQLDNLLAVPGNYSSRIRDLAEGIEGAPTALWTTLDAEFTGLMQDLEAITDAVGSIISLNFLNVIPSETKTTDDSIASQNLVNRTSKASVLLNGLSTLTNVGRATDDSSPGYKTTQEAAAAAEWATAAVEDLIENLDPPDELILALKEVLTACQDYFASVMTGLPTVVKYTPAHDMPACVVAYLLYGDASRGDRIVLRNSIPDAMSVPGGVELEVLDQ